MQQPILTIGIPTYNRSKLLANLLSCIFYQVKASALADKIQVVVSNNNSTDDTEAVVDEFIKKGLKIDYSRNEENIGGNNNILKVGYELAKAPYCWIIGDDDLIRDGGIAYYLKLLEDNKGVELFYLNHTNEPDADRQLIINNAAINPQRVMCNLDEDRLLPNGQTIVEFTTHNALFTSVSCTIFKTSVWKEKFIGYQPYQSFDTLNNTFPHTVILAANLMQKPVFYVGYPYLAFFVGAQEWFSKWELMVATRVVELTDCFEQHGAGERFLKIYRERLFKDVLGAFFRIFTRNEMAEWCQLNYWQYVMKYSKYKNFRITTWHLAIALFKMKIKLRTRLRSLLNG